MINRDEYSSCSHSHVWLHAAQVTLCSPFLATPRVEVIREIPHLVNKVVMLFFILERDYITINGINE